MCFLSASTLKITFSQLSPLWIVDHQRSKPVHSAETVRNQAQQKTSWDAQKHKGVVENIAVQLAIGTYCHDTDVAGSDVVILTPRPPVWFSNTTRSSPCVAKVQSRRTICQKHKPAGLPPPYCRHLNRDGCHTHPRVLHPKQRSTLLQCEHQQGEARPDVTQESVRLRKDPVAERDGSGI